MSTRSARWKPLADVVKAGVLRGAVAMVGCNNPKVRPDTAHIELMKKLLKNDIIVIVSGCSAQAAAKAGLMDLSTPPNTAARVCAASASWSASRPSCIWAPALIFPV